MSAAAGKGKQTLCLAQRNTLALRTAWQNPTRRAAACIQKQGRKSRGAESSADREGLTAALGQLHQTEAPQREGRLGTGQSKGRFTAEIKPREKVFGFGSFRVVI